MKDKLKQEGKNQNPLFSIQSAKDSLANFIACKLGVSVVELKKVERWVRTDDKSFTDNGGGEKSGIIFEINLESQGNVRFALITESLLDEIATEIRDTAEWFRHLRSFWRQYGSLASANVLVPREIKNIHRQLDTYAVEIEQFYLNVARDLSKKPQKIAAIPTNLWEAQTNTNLQSDPILAEMFSKILKSTDAIALNTAIIAANTTPKSEPRDRIITLVQRVNVEMFGGKSIPKAVNYVRCCGDVAEKYAQSVAEARQFAISFVKGESSRKKNEESFWNGIKKEAQPSAAKSAAKRKSKRSANPSSPPGPVPILDADTGGGLY